VKETEGAVFFNNVGRQKKKTFLISKR
jgi:hypothetical protein